MQRVYLIAFNRFRGRGNLGGPVFGGGYGGDFNGFGGGGRGGRGRGGRGGGRGFRSQGRGGGGGGNNFGMMSSTGHSVHMRGLPYAAKENDVKQFFMPLNPVNIWMEYSNGSFSGQVDVDFATREDAQAAMLKNNQSMGRILLVQGALLYALRWFNIDSGCFFFFSLWP